MEKKKEDQKKQGKEIGKLQKDLYDVTAALNELNEQGQEGGGTLQLADSQLKEYHRIKEEAGLKTAKLRDEKEVYDSQQQADVEAQKNLEENLLESINLEQQLASQEEEMQAWLKRFLYSFGKNTKELSKVQSELGQMKYRHHKFEIKYDNLEGKVYEIEVQLRELKAVKSESEIGIHINDISP